MNILRTSDYDNLTSKLLNKHVVTFCILLLAMIRLGSWYMYMTTQAVAMHTMLFTVTCTIHVLQRAYFVMKP